MTFFCPCCFAEIPQAAKSCQLCGVDIELWRNHPYTERLTHALGHPLAEIRASTSSDITSQVRTLIDDFANHGGATERILALGEGAITPLRRYLSDGAQVIPQGRLLAVSMLARFQCSQAREGVRDVLHGTRLHELPLAWQNAEYRVKDTAIRLLLTHAYPEQLTDVVYAVEKERLPSAVALAGELGLSSLAPLLVTMLEDDVLERAAGLSLKALGTLGQTAILQALPVLFDDAQSRVRSRLAVIRALLLLHQDPYAVLPSWVVSCTRKEAHPGVRAAGALLANGFNRDDMDMLVHGALSDYTSLASACRERLVDQGLEFVIAALAALRRNAEPDIYGNQHPLGRSAIRWLVTEVLKSPRTDARAREAVMAGMDPNLLAMGLTSMQNPTEEFLREIGRHPSSVVREAANALSKSGVQADTTFRRGGPRIYHHRAGH
jgi:hypothetical protein